MKNLKSLLALAGMFIFSLNAAFAQQRPAAAPRPGAASRPSMEQAGQRMEKLESAKIGFLTQKLDLSPREAEKFWPIYNQYQNEMKGLAKERMAARKAGDEVSADQRLDEQMELESRVLDIRKKYTREFTRVIPSEKVVRLYEAEKQFKQELIKRLQERRKQ